MVREARPIHVSRLIEADGSKTLPILASLFFHGLMSSYSRTTSLLVGVIQIRHAEVIAIARTECRSTATSPSVYKLHIDFDSNKAQAGGLAVALEPVVELSGAL
ncbi:hypothetical protein ABIF86_000442 [Bradyrhizobium japonicum]